MTAKRLGEKQDPLPQADQGVQPINYINRLVVTLVFLLCGLAIFILGSPYFSIFPTNRNPRYLAVLATFFLLVTVVFHYSSRLRQYRPVAYAFFIATIANLSATLGPFNFIIQKDTALQNIVTDKLAQFLAIVLPILILTKVAGNDFGSIFLKRGNLRRGLIFGSASFVFFAVVAIVQALGANITIEMLIPAIPGFLVFVFANAFMEELWFRGIFLKHFQPFIGMFLSILVTSLVFGAAHLGATYVSGAEVISFSILVFFLGLVGAYVIYRTDSIWGAVLLHAGYDLVVIIPILESVS